MTKKEILYTAVVSILILGLMFIWFAGYFDGTIMDGILRTAFPALIISVGIVLAEMIVYEIILAGREVNKAILFLVSFAAATYFVNAVNDAEIILKIVGVILIASIIALVLMGIYLFRNR